MIWHLLLAVLVISAVESARIKGNHSTTVDLLHHSSLQGEICSSFSQLSVHVK
uniref:Uncharacterized protein n=1 Tax=Trichobilharzia regenti TaxID=157069 RepID=A0AA85IXT4_TRIRE|nr:unnamed protein product [Trichobilharzia regenti]CAH8862728.1 unnamed protein product [Trichobilharzia regenti]